MLPYPFSKCEYIYIYAYVHIYYFVCLNVLSACICTPGACSALRGQKKASDPLGLELDSCVLSYGC